MAVTEKAPGEIFGDGFTIAGILMTVIGTFAFGLAIVSWISGAEVTLGLTGILPQMTVSILLIVVGIVFAVVGHYSKKVLIAGKKKR